VPLTDRQRVGLARDLQRAVARVAPGWTDVGAHDPGITMLQLLAFALADLQHRHSALDPHGRLLARDVAARAAALVSALDGDDGSGELRRVNYFEGMLLGVADFRAEQDYLRQRLNRRNRLLHGAGVVTGLTVTLAASGGAGQVSIAPGMAFDPAGNEICIETPCVLALPANGTALLVQLSYRERLSANVASGPSGTDDGSATLPTRIVETFAATLSAAADANAIGIARLRHGRGKWRLDPKFEAPLAR
jgi:hypothetical protein